MTKGYHGIRLVLRTRSARLDTAQVVRKVRDLLAKEPALHLVRGTVEPGLVKPPQHGAEIEVLLSVEEAAKAQSEKEKVRNKGRTPPPPPVRRPPPPPPATRRTPPPPPVRRPPPPVK